MQPPARVTKPLSIVGELASVRDVVIAPMRAFATIKEYAPWRAAFLVTALANTLAYFLQIPALQHIAATLARTATADDLPQADPNDAFLSGFGFAALPLVLAGLFAAGMTLLTPRSALATRRLSIFFSLALTASAPASLAQALSKVFVLARPAASFATAGQLVSWPPVTLANLIPQTIDQEQIFLSNVDIFLLWGYIVTAFGYAAITGLSFNRALAVTFGCGLGLVLFELFL